MRLRIETSLKRAVNQLPHASFEKIAFAPVQQMMEQDWVTRQYEARPAHKLPARVFATAIACCCAILILLGGGWVWQNAMVDSWITIDVNPSFEIMVSRRDCVVELRALNTDAAELVNGNNFRGWPIDQAIEELFSLLGKSRFMSPQKNAVLLSVRNRDEAHYHKLEQELTQKIQKALSNSDISPRIVCQALHDDEATLQQEALQYHVSAGKLQVAQQLSQYFPSYSMEQLLTLPLGKLLELLKTPMVPENADSTEAKGHVHSRPDWDDNDEPGDLNDQDTSDDADVPDDQDASDDADVPDDQDASDDADVPDDQDASDDADVPDDQDTSDDADVSDDQDILDDVETPESEDDLHNPEDENMADQET